MILQGGCLLAIGTFISTTTRNQIIAGGATFAVCLMLWVLDWVSAYDQSAWAKVVSYLSVVTHFEPFSKGVIDTKDVIFYLSMIFFGLFLTTRSVESLRWRVVKMNSEWLKARQTRYGAYLFTYLVVIIAVLGATNWLANRHNKSFDATSNKRFSLSEQTGKVVKGLNRDVTITYFDKTTEFGRARDLLDRYANLSSRLHLEYVDPDKKPQLAKAANVRTYGTIYIDSGLRKEEAKSLTEEDITGALIRSLKSGERNVCFVTGSGEHGLDDSGRTGYSSVKEALEKNNYKTRTVSLLEVGARCSATGRQTGPACRAPPPILQSPRSPRTAPSWWSPAPSTITPSPKSMPLRLTLRMAAARLFLIDPPLKLGRDDYSGSPALAAVIDTWGVTLDKDLALDTSGVGQIFGLGPEVPLVTSYESQPIVRDLKDVATAFPLARTLEVKSSSSGTAEKLFSTSSQ